MLPYAKPWSSYGNANMFTKPNSRDTGGAGLKGAVSSVASGPKLQHDESLGYVVVDSKATFRGELVTEGDIVIDGVFEGVIQGRKLIVTVNGRVAGKVRVDNAKVSGIVEPEIHCREVLEITSTGTVRGSAAFGGLVVAMGGKLFGQTSEYVPEAGTELHGTPAAPRRGQLQAVEVKNIQPSA